MYVYIFVLTNRFCDFLYTPELIYTIVVLVDFTTVNKYFGFVSIFWFVSYILLATTAYAFVNISNFNTC